MSRPVVAITHDQPDIGRFFAAPDLARLEQVAELRVVGRNRAAQLPALGAVEVLLGSWGMPKIDGEMLTAAPRLRAVCYAAGSVKGFALPEAFARDVIITTAMHANAVPVSEAVVALITLINKGWFRCQDRIRAHGLDAWKSASAPGNYGASVGLVGLGAIGRMVAERLKSLELQVFAFDPYASREAFAQVGAEPVADLVELARKSRILSLHAPNIPACTKMIDARVLAAMPDGATFINTARGALVDETALIAELRTGRIDAHLDVTQPEPPAAGSELLRLPNVWLTPHLAGSINDEIRRMGKLAIDECLRILAGQPAQHRVLEHHLATMA
ncbi:glycerate dehydrogenase [Planctomycetota bacterium]|nr:glycerate dehydrogenase [Planctomycetota bacterium]